jgi:hypothetical protein
MTINNLKLVILVASIRLANVYRYKTVTVCKAQIVHLSYFMLI